MGQRLEGIERMAIWTAHSKKCAYCEDPLNYADLEIDHIIPKSLRKRPTQLQKLLAQLELPPDFDLDTLKNLLPAHRRCNLRKRARVFSQANARFFLEVAETKLDSINVLIRKLELETSRENLLAMVQRALQSGSIGLDEILETAANTENFSLNATIDFKSGTWEVRADTEKINQLLDEPVDLHTSGRGEGARFTNGKGSELPIHTCREYKSAISTGYYPSDNTELKVSLPLATASAVLDAASRAKLAPISYLRSPRLGLTNLDLLPAQIAPKWRSDGSEITLGPNGRTIKQLLDAQRISVRIHSDMGVVIECGDHVVGLTELMRADFDDDGVEEILVKRHLHIKYATFRSLGIGLLRKRDQASIFDYQPWNIDIEISQHRHQIARIMR